MALNQAPKAAQVACLLNCSKRSRPVPFGTNEKDTNSDKIEKKQICPEAKLTFKK